MVLASAYNLIGVYIIIGVFYQKNCESFINRSLF